ncbi:MAG: hypothetical protein QM718_14940 [Steroidobacteraceae bacterium]
MRIEAPNWSPDGRWLVFNGDGRLFRVPSDGRGEPQPIDTGAIYDVSNDHLFSPDGRQLYFTAGGQIHRVPFSGGTPQTLSTADGDDPLQLYLHGISPDGQWLSATALHTRSARLAIHALPTSGGQSHCILEPGVAIDGPEYAPDGEWLYFNSELQGRWPGDSQLFRARRDGSGIEQLTRDERVNWFPHLAPDNGRLAYLSYAPRTEGHPANRDVLLRCLTFADGAVHDIIALCGGQGTLNGNSWAPDSRHLAYVAYPPA